MTWMVAAQFAPVPSRRKRGGLPAGCSAIILAWALLLAPQAGAATEPLPDPMPHVHPDAAPVKKAPVGLPTQPPATQQPATQAPTADKPVAKEPAAQQPTSTNQPSQPAVTPRPATTPSTTPAATHASQATGRRNTARKPDRAKQRRVTRPEPAPSARADDTIVRHRRDAFVAARRVARTLAVATPRASNGSRDDGALFAGAALLLLVGATGSLLRLSARMSGDVFRGRPG